MIQTLRPLDLLAHVILWISANARVGGIKDFDNDFLIIGGRCFIQFKGETLSDLSMYLIAVECFV